MELWHLCIVFDAVLFLVGAALAYLGARKSWGRHGRRCPTCLYDMAGVPGLRCPECGTEARDERDLLRADQVFRPHERRLVIAGSLLISFGVMGLLILSVVRNGGIGA